MDETNDGPETFLIESALENVNLKTESNAKISNSEDYRKLLSESTSIVSDSSEGYTDSDTNSLRSLDFNKKPKKVD